MKRVMAGLLALMMLILTVPAQAAGIGEINGTNDSGLQLAVSNPVYDVTGLPVSFTITATYQVELPMLFDQHPLYISLHQRQVSEWKPHFR